jgi:tRNA nucleotidyltransferase/poly(A) polymerase
VRDLLMGRPVVDIDLVVERDPAAVAREIARSGGGAPFPLSERHGAWRVVRGDGHTVDVAAMRGSLEDDLRLRDFTINAIARRLGGDELIDPTGGRADVEARLLRAISPAVFDDDPLRLLRLARIAHELGMQIEPGTDALARERAELANRPSGERTFMELRRLLAAPDPADGIRLVDRLGVLDVIVPELTACKGLEQTRHHALDVFEHTLMVVDAVADVAAHPSHYLPRHEQLVSAAMAEDVGDEAAAWLGLRFAALFHDIAKPLTLTRSQGRVGFPDHDRRGAELTRTVLNRWKPSGLFADFCSRMVRRHLTLGFSSRAPLDRRAAFRYRRVTHPWEVASVVLSLGDRLSTRGAGSKLRHLRSHSEGASAMLDMLAVLDAEAQEPLLRGDEIAELSGARGRRIGELVAALAEEQAAGTVTTREEAVDLVTKQV